MKTNLDEMLAFVSVVDSGSISAAAEQLEQTASGPVSDPLAAAQLTTRAREILRLGSRDTADAPREPVLLVGTDASADLFLRAIRQGPARYDVIGIIDSSSTSSSLCPTPTTCLCSTTSPSICTTTSSTCLRW